MPRRIQTDRDIRSVTVACVKKDQGLPVRFHGVRAKMNLHPQRLQHRPKRQSIWAITVQQDYGMILVDPLSRIMNKDR